MKRRIATRLFVLLFVIVGSTYMIASRSLVLGLDLRGGVQVTLEVLTDEVIRGQTDKTLETIHQEIEVKHSTPLKISRRGTNELEIVGLNEQAAGELSKLLPSWEYSRSLETGGATYRLRMDAATQRDLRESATTQAMRVIENRLNSLGVSEISLQRSGKFDIQVQVPGVSNADYIKETILATASLEFKPVDQGPFPNPQAANALYGGTIPPSLEILKEARDPRSPATHDSYYVVRKAAIISGVDLKTANVSRDSRERPAVAFGLSADGGRRFGNFTEQNRGRSIAIVLDGVIQSVAGIQAKITDAGIIEGGQRGFTLEQARSLTVVLRSGALPAPVKYGREQVVGPSLGADSVRAGMAASGVSIAAVSAFMIAHYRMSGAVAVATMLFNLLILLGAMAYLLAPLTLPGIAGVVLTIGMGIDSNVLIFERIREELQLGKTAASALALGFQRVFRTLVDTHLAAMISAGILFMFGLGPIRGFAITLAVGLASNLFAAVFASRTLLECLIARRGARLSI